MYFTNLQGYIYIMKYYGGGGGYGRGETNRIEGVGEMKKRREKGDEFIKDEVIKVITKSLSIYVRAVYEYCHDF